MKVNFIGYKKVDFTPKDGESIHGTKIFVTNTEKDVVGLTSTSFWVDDKDREDMLLIDLDTYVGDSIDVEVNLKGKLVAISA